MKKKFYSILALLAMSVIPALSQTATFNFTGGVQTFTVPCGVDTLFVQAWGAQGGSGDLGGNSVAGGSGGLGGYSEGWLLVTPGEVLNIMVGGQGGTPTGGFNGGANGGSTNAGGGGGASDIRQNGSTEAERVITAGGGGGGGRGGCHEGAGIGGVGGNGGSGGGGVGANGNDSPQSSGVAGGGFGGNFGSVQGALGAKGIGCAGFSGTDGSTATTGSGAVGGAGQTCCCSSSNSIPGGGGGGGGQLGGGGGGGGSAGTTGCSGNSKGAGGGGGGGSSYTGGVLNGATNAGIWLGNGQVSISWNPVTIVDPVIVASTFSICVGDTVTLSLASMAPNANGGFWIPNSFVTSTDTTQEWITVTGVTPGTGNIIVTWYEACGDSASDTVSFTVNANPTVAFSTMSMACLDDGAVALSGSPAGGTFSGTAVSGSNFSPSTAGTGTYVLTYNYTDSLGCSGMDTASITVDPCLGVSSIPAGSVVVSPNPAVDVLNLAWNASAGVATITVIDVTGRVVMTKTAVNGTTAQLDVKSLPSGTYTVTLEGKEKIVQTFVKQ